MTELSDEESDRQLALVRQGSTECSLRVLELLLRLNVDSRCTLIAVYYDVRFDTLYDSNWTDEEVTSHIDKLYCLGLGLRVLPDLPNCQQLDCSFNKLTVLPPLSRCRWLRCEHNLLIKLPDLPVCRNLMCSHNKLTKTPCLNNVRHYDCSDNQLTSIGPISIQAPAHYCFGSNPDLPFTDLKSWQKVWKLRDYLIKLKYFRRWYWRILNRKAREKKVLHAEILFTPNIRFLPNEYMKAKEEFMGLVT